MTCGFLIQLVFCKEKKTMWFIGVEVQQETSAPPPKKKSWIRPCIWKTSLKLLCRRTLKEQRLSKILCSVFKLVNNKTNPESLNELISLRETTYAFRGKDILKVPKVNTTRFALSSWRYQAPKICNNLPDVVRASSDFKTFKKLLENESLF